MESEETIISKEEIVTELNIIWTFLSKHEIYKGKNMLEKLIDKLREEMNNGI